MKKELVEGQKEDKQYIILYWRAKFQAVREAGHDTSKKITSRDNKLQVWLYH